MPERTPEEALETARMALDMVVDGKTILEHDLGQPIATLDLWSLSVETGFRANDATVLAILGRREDVFRLHGWIKAAAQRLIAEDSPEGRYLAYDKVLVTLWLCEGEPDQGFLVERASCFPKAVPDDPEHDIFQALRLIDAGMLAEARAFLHALKPGTPVLVHSARRLTPVTALHLAIDCLEGKAAPAGYAAEFRKLLSRLRKSYFTGGSYSAMVPWVRVYNRLFVGEPDPWQVMAWLRTDPVKAAPVARCS